MSLTEWLLFGWILFMGWLCWQALHWTCWFMVMVYVWMFRGCAHVVRWGIRATKSSRATAGRRP